MIGGYNEAGPLTPRLRAVLIAAASGETAKETAFRLSRSPATIERQRRAATSRLGARTLPHAVALAARRGLLASLWDDGC